ncbi:biotin-dependent carboxyltransferase family protein [Phycicoccus sp. BSK3Z-2]|uniref:Biotin-dependent carboxyltransferase family protein n=1 Tax=Phycicoccus avicenniae TaxID=2828860 RepID=A0A941D9H3_9MICO|nr:biotin-dependent carboxyltransferase family protein [Phycicoccus avicenniae]MBR7744016.1 biotin-dependent carboxyltransferase family protein [Phycicoccus avicenniae]
MSGDAGGAGGLRRTLTVRATGPLALLEDLGRPGLAGLGVGRSGAADRGALRLANRLLGNPEGATCVEVTAGGLDLEVGDAAVTFCVSGARGEITVDGRAVGSHGVVHAPAGSRVRLGPPEVGLRSYLAVRGGVVADPVLESASRDVLSGLGPEPLSVGAVLAVGADPGTTLPGADVVPWPPAADPVVLHAVRGPREDRVEDADLLVRTTWRTTDRSNRVGARLEGGRFRHTGQDQLPSEGVWRGAVQVPPSGEPVLFLADHPVTGGYPVVAVVVDADVDRAAQLRPGDAVAFRWVPAP